MSTATLTEPATRRALPGDFAMWVFILAELLVFGIFFLAYAFARSADVVMFNAGQLTLHRELGAVNTVLLITSSYLVVRAVAAIGRDDAGASQRWLIGATALGAAFLGVKVYEFSVAFGQGISLSTNTFYMFYLSLTFFHFMHVILGMLILIGVIVRLRQGHYDAGDHTGVETAASYWHMVDLVWILLFPLVYVIR
jgi:nitric oxide reductase NorE protein